MFFMFVEGLFNRLKNNAVANPAGIYLFKVNYGNTITVCEMC